MVGADSAEVIVLQDFRWSREMIPWSDLLLLLEGETVKFIYLFIYLACQLGQGHHNSICQLLWALFA